MADPNVPAGSPTPRIEDSVVQNHPFRASFHGREDGTPGYLAVESGYIIPGGFLSGYEALLPSLAGAPLQDPVHTGEITHIVDPPVGDYYLEATGGWREIGVAGGDTLEFFTPTTAEILHRNDINLTDDTKRALKIFRLESDGRIAQYIRSDIPMNIVRNATTPDIPPPEPSKEPSSSSGSSSSSSSGSSSSSSSGGITNDSAFVHWFIIPDELETEQTYWMDATFRNIGEEIWYPGLHKLVPTGHDWGMFEVPLTTVTPPGVERTFNLELYAPSVPGVYDLQFRMAGPEGLFGASSPDHPVNVVPPLVPPEPDSSSSSSSSSGGSTPSSSSSSSGSGGGGPSSGFNATFVSQLGVPPEIEAGSTAEVTLTFRNVGIEDWVPDPIFLHSQYPADNTYWGLNEVPLPGLVLSGAEVNFTFVITAPPEPGGYVMQWMLHHAFDGFFGAASLIREIEVVPAIGSGGSSSSS